jgi:hypothetical protein
MSKHISPIVHGRVESGKFIPTDRAMFRSAFYAHEGKPVEVSVKRYRKRRSTQANAYYWGVVVAMIGDYVGESDPQTIHEMLKAAHNYEIKTVDGKEIRIPQSTADLTTVEFKEYIERVTRWASEYLSLYIPEPNEVEIADAKMGQAVATVNKVFEVSE